MLEKVFLAARLLISLTVLVLTAGTASAISWVVPSGSIEAQFGVNHDGDAVYSVPIKVPPGTGGMQPHLTLVYESSVPDGPMGVGWRLQGLEQVGRCRPTLVQDGFSGTIDYSHTDRFCLDGERLVAVAGVYGADGTVYHTERESRVRVTSFGTCGNGPCSFELVRRDGVVLELGSTADSRVLRQGGADARAWAASSYRDPRGNTLRVTYTQDQGAVYPTTIDYTENGDLAAGRQVSFTYQDRPSALPRYDQGARVRYGRALSTIETRVGTELVRSYSLEYDNLSGHFTPRLERLDECAGDGACLAPTFFQWTSAPATIKSYGFDSAPGLDFGHEPRAFADVNGDGRADFCRAVGTAPNLRLSCALAAEQGFSGELSSASEYPFDFGYLTLPRAFVDVNGDGRADYCRGVGDDPGIFLSCALAGESGFGRYDFDSAPGFDFGHAAPHKRAFTDINGDGRVDYCRATGISPTILACALAGGQGFEAAEITSPADVPFDFGYQNFPRDFVDVDGDGRSEFCRAVGISPNIFLSCASVVGSEFEFYSFNSVPAFDFGIPSYPQEFADVNGDGRADYCRAVGISPNIYLACALSLGDRFGMYDMMSIPTPNPTGFDFGLPSYPRRYVDADGDGRADYCRFVGIAPNIYLSCAAAGDDGFGIYDFSSPSSTWLDPGYGYPYPRVFAPAVPGGGSSFCRAVGDSPNIFLSCTTLPPQGDRIRRIVDGQGQSLEISYAPLDDPSVYTPSSGAVYPRRDVRGGSRYVVSSYTRASLLPSDLGAFHYTYSYSYAGGRMSEDGRGWLGFREITRRDNDLGLVTVTRMLQDFPFTGLAESDTLLCDPLYGKDAACTELAAVHRTTRTYATTVPFAGVTEVLSREVLTEALEYGAPGTSTRQVFDHDSYGNVIREQRTSSTSAALSSQLFIHRQYRNDPARNRFGFMTEEVHSRDAAANDVLTRTERTYDPETLTVGTQSRWDSTSGGLLTSEYTYDGFGNPVRVTSPGGLVRNLTYDPVHHTFRVIESTPAAGGGPELTRSWTYDARFGKQSSHTDPAGTTTTTTFDGFGRTSKVEGPHPETGVPTLRRSERWFGVNGLTVHEITTPLDWDGRRVTRRDTMDGLGRVVRSAFFGDSGETRYQHTHFSSSGRITARSKLYTTAAQPVFETYRYDSRQRPVEAVDTAGLRTRYTYSAPARVSSVIGDGTGQARTRTLDYVNVNARPRPGSVEHGNGQRIDFSYDVLGRLLSAGDSVQGDLLRNTFDSLGRHTRVWNPEAGAVEMTYDSAGRLESRVSRDGAGTRTFTYDELGRLVREVAQADGGVSETLDYGWDGAAPGAVGRLASVSSDSGYSYSYTYDQVGRVKRQDIQVQGRWWALQQTFDPAGRNLSTLFPDGSRTTTSYSDVGVLASVDFTEVDGTLRRLMEITEILPDTRPSKLDLGPLSLQLDWTQEGFLTGRSARTDGLQLVDDETVERTAGRFVDGITDHLAPSNSQAFTYDGAGQLTTAFGGYAGEVLSYGENGDILSRSTHSYQYEDGRVVRVTDDQGEIFTATYDDGGRMTGRVVPAGADVLRYGARGRLEEVQRDGATLASFLYDHRGRRIYKSEGGVETFYVSHDFEETVHAGGAQQTRYVRAPQGGYATVSRGAAVARDGYPADGDQFFLTDHLGSVRKVFDGQGLLKASVDYTPFGEVWSQSGAKSFRHGFAGMELDRSTGLLYDRARYYDAGLGRFITPDSRLGAGMVELAAFNRYAYGANDPLYFIDPSGHNILSDAWSWIKHHGKIVGAVIGAAEIVAGVAVTVFSGGLLATTIGRTLIGAGAAGLNYSLVSDHFSWRDWGAAEGLGASIAYLANLTIDVFGGVGAAAGAAGAAGEAAAVAAAQAGGIGAAEAAAVDGIAGALGAYVSVPVSSGLPSPVSSWRSLPESTLNDRDISRLFDLGSPSGLTWAGGRL